jgi:superfamily II DNA helicase RecQ
MKLKFFWVPAWGGGEVEEEVNAFLVAHRVVQLERVFVSQGAVPGWALCMEWVPQDEVMPPATGGGGAGQKVDWREVLDAGSFRIFAALRAWRKERAAADKVPIYAVATNEQLAAVARNRIGTKDGLAAVNGFGPGRVSRYGDALLAAYASAVEEPVAAAGHVNSQI